MGRLARLLSIALLAVITAHTARADSTVAVIHTAAATPGAWQVTLKESGAMRADGALDPGYQIVALGGGTLEHLSWLEQLSDSAEGRVHLLVSEADLLLADQYPEVADYVSSNPFVLQLGRWAFAHGGISGKYNNESIQELNERVRLEVAGYQHRVDELLSSGALRPGESISVAEKRLQGSVFKRKQLKALTLVADMMVSSDQAPHQYRGTALCHPYAESFNVERFLKKVDAGHLVVSTDSRQGILKRMAGLVYAIGETASPDFLLIQNNNVRRASGKPFSPDRRLISEELSDMSDAEMEYFLEKAQVIRVQDIGTGITKPLRVTQQMGDITQDAVFKYVDSSPGLESQPNYRKKSEDSDRYIYEVAAYRLDRLLNLQMIPSAVLTEVNDKHGVLQDWVTGAINERDRVESGMPFEGACPQHEQYRLRFVLDLLIHNEDRNLTNILWDKEEYMLWFIDHTRAFRTNPDRPDMYSAVVVRVSDLLREKLLSLNESNLTETLAGYLHPQQIEAILIRRDKMLKQALTTDSTDI